MAQITIEDVDAIAAQIKARFPPDEDEPDCEIETRVILQGVDYNYDRGEIKRGRFVLQITDELFGDHRDDIATALDMLNFSAEIEKHGTVALAGPVSKPPGMDWDLEWGVFRLCWDR